MTEATSERAVLMRASERIYPVFGIIEEHLDNGALFVKQQGMWHLFSEDGESIASGPTIRELCVNLVLGY